MRETRKPGSGIHPRFRAHEVDDGALCGTVTTLVCHHKCRVQIAKNRHTIHPWTHKLEMAECERGYAARCPDHEEKR